MKKALHTEDVIKAWLGNRNEAIKVENFSFSNSDACWRLRADVHSDVADVTVIFWQDVTGIEKSNGTIYACEFARDCESCEDYAHNGAMSPVLGCLYDFSELLSYQNVEVMCEHGPQIARAMWTNDADELETFIAQLAIDTLTAIK